MPRTKEQNNAIKIEKKQKIMSIALHLFAEDGYVHTSIEKIATHAGISKGLMYSYFRSKDDLLREIIHKGAETISGNLFPENMSAEELIDGVEKMLDGIEAHKGFFKLYTALSVQPGVSQKVGYIVDTNIDFHHLIEYMQQHCGDKAHEEVLLLSAIMKGYSLLALYGSSQRLVSIEPLKETIMNFIRERYSNI
ncbi:MAG: TetR/AcrR family transcriptional regulator [Tannerellaceae bacterium]|jgi:AcrR family transcriptional regulator|nr:TetR/AcrR family transcriptional regulator [Tannerellaceae bacterium]